MSSGSVFATLPAFVAVKVLLYQGMRDQGVGKAELARRLGWHMQQVDRALDLLYKSRFDRMKAALSAMGLQLHIDEACHDAA